VLGDRAIDSTNIYRRRSIVLVRENRAPLNFDARRKFHGKKAGVREREGERERERERESPLRSLGPFAVEFFKTTLNLPPGCKRRIISFMGRAHRPSAIRHRPGVTFASSLPIHRHACNVQCRCRCAASRPVVHGGISGICGYVETRVPGLSRAFLAPAIVVSLGSMRERDARARARDGTERKRKGRREKKGKEKKNERERQRRTSGREKGDRASVAGRSTGEKSRKPAGAVGAFIAYGSAKHLWNNGAGEVHRWRRKTKVFSTRENPQDRVLLLARRRAGRSCARAAHVHAHTRMHACMHARVVTRTCIL
jgi:hypothetical protein